LLRELQSKLTITEDGKQKRIRKSEVIAKTATPRIGRHKTRAHRAPTIHAAEQSRHAQCDDSHIPLLCDLALLMNLRPSGLLNMQRQRAYPGG
jgi:hypothetical protein